MRVLIFISFLFLQCTEPSNNGCRLLSEQESYARAIKNDLVYTGDQIFDISGSLISKDSMMKLAVKYGSDYVADYCVNQQGGIVELRLRKSKWEDRLLISKIGDRLNYKHCDSTITSLGNIELSQLIETIAENDRRRFESNIKCIQRDYLEHVIQAIESGEILDKEQMTIVWLAVQHGSNAHRMRMLKHFLEAEERGLLNASQIALTQDRIAMHMGLPQKYGTQIRNGSVYRYTSEREVLQNRDSVGLGDWCEYLQLKNVACPINISQ